jgi:hypothetical protein
MHCLVHASTVQVMRTLLQSRNRRCSSFYERRINGTCVYDLLGSYWSVNKDITLAMAAESANYWRDEVGVTDKERDESVIMMSWVISDTKCTRRLGENRAVSFQTPLGYHRNVWVRD